MAGDGKALVLDFDGVLARERPVYGARRLLESARARGWRVGLITAGAQGEGQAWLVRTDLASQIDAIAVANDSAPYLAVLRRLDCSPQAALAVVATAPGREAALAAGLTPLWYRPLFEVPLSPGPAVVDCLPAVIPWLGVGDRRVAIRLATADDRAFLYGLRNDPASVAHFRTARRLRTEELEERFRFDPTLRDKITVIASAGDEPLAMVRFDRQASDYLISIGVRDTCRGQGWGVLCLNRAIDAFLAMHGPTSFLADVAEDNEASIRLFRRCRFGVCGRDGRFLRFSRSGLVGEP